MADRAAPPEAADRRLSLVIPAYNEAAGIRLAVAEAEAALGRLVADHEILVVDDGSTDGTAAVVAAAARDNPRVRLLRHNGNRGYGAALRTGFAAARFDRVAFTDADCQFHLDDLTPLLDLTDSYPVAVGYRVGRQDPWPRRFFSWGYNTLVRALLGTRVRDCDCALKVFRQETLADLLPETPGFFVNTEMLTRARQHGYRVAEAGVRHRPRLRGCSKVSLGDIPRTLRTLLPFWWSRVLFAGARGTGFQSGQGPTGLESGPTKPVWHLLALLLAAVLLCFSRLGAPLQEPDEARYAEVPRQMLAEGHWVVPVLHGEAYPDKPPLLYWLVMASYRLCGVHDWAARLVPGGTALLVVLLTYLWGRRTVGPRAAFAAAAILCLSARFVYLGRLLTPDTLLCLCVAAATAAAHLAVRGRQLRWGWWLASAVACGCGLLTKGPVALALVTVPLLAVGGLDPRTARPGWHGWLLYLGVAAGLAAPWYAAMSVADPEFATTFFWRHNVVRYLAPFDHAKPVWFHLPGLLMGMLPWTLLLPGLLRFLARHSARTANRRPAALGFFLLAFVWPLLFYSLAGCKRAVYILPALPPLALALGCYLDAVLPAGGLRRLLIRRSQLRLRPADRLAFAGTLLVVAVAGIGSLVAGRAGLLRPTTAVLLAGATAAFLVVVWRGAKRNPVLTSWAGCGVATFVVLFLSVQLVLPSYARKFSLRGDLRPQARLCVDPAVPVVSYPRRWDSVGFYLRRSDVQVFTPAQADELMTLLRARPGTVLVVKSEGPLDQLVRELPPSLEFVPSGRRGTVTVGQARPRPVAPDGLLVRGAPWDRIPILSKPDRIGILSHESERASGVPCPGASCARRAVAAQGFAEVSETRGDPTPPVTGCLCLPVPASRQFSLKVLSNFWAASLPSGSRTNFRRHSGQRSYRKLWCGGSASVGSTRLSSMSRISWLTASMWSSSRSASVISAGSWAAKTSSLTT
jgi:4-amino-4-deoxy-L-arabinose transferase-like glycosyltransferase